MAVSSTIDQTADEQGNLLANPIHSYDDWESQFSTDSSLDFEEKLPSYIDYLRTSFFERGELTKEVETSYKDSMQTRSLVIVKLLTKSTMILHLDRLHSIAL